MAGAGNLIGVHDMWLAAVCISRGLSIATANVREFGRVEGLQIEDWTKPLPTREKIARRAQPPRRRPVRLPTDGDGGLQPGVDLDDSAALLDRMERG